MKRVLQLFLKEDIDLEISNIYEYFPLASKK